MQGQWLGSYSGNSSGDILIDIDEVDERLVGYGILRPDHQTAPQAPVVFARFDVAKANQFSISIPVFCIDPRDGSIKTWSDVAALFPGYSVPQSATINVALVGTRLSVDWTADDGTSLGSAQIARSTADQPSNLPAHDLASWHDFKALVGDARPYEFIFRGQRSNKWRLRTSFHRTGFANLERYGGPIMETVSRYMSAQTDHFFNVEDPRQYGAFVTLLQHHGFPTPLLDWTFSPFVAAFFAYSSISKEQALKATDQDRVRILRFSRQRWVRIPQTLKLAPVPPHFSLLEGLAIDNKRLVPQQGLSTITNVDDIESYMLRVERVHQTTYLEAIDLPVAERQHVMRELALMGVTAGAMYPGLDGTCAELRERFFVL